MRSLRLTPCLLGLALVLSAASARAEDIGAIVSTTPKPATDETPRAPRPAKPASPFDAVTPISAKELGGVRAGEDIYAAISDQRLSATNSGNSVIANSVQSGAVNLQDGAFNGFNGLGNFVINTGNNNNLQGSLSVTIMMAPAAIAAH